MWISFKRDSGRQGHSWILYNIIIDTYCLVLTYIIIYYLRV